MRKGSLIAACTLAIAVLSGPVLAQDAPSDEAAVQRPDRGDRIERRLDRRGDVVDRKLDRKARRADANGHERRAHHLERKGDRVDRKLDRRGRQIDRRVDRRTDRRN
jgi:hypothetical protein